MLAGVAELPGIAFAATLPFAVGYVPRHFVYLDVASGQYGLALAFIEGKEDVGRGVYPVVECRGRQLQPEFGEHLHLTVLGKMMIEFVVHERGKQIGSDMTAADYAVRTRGLNYRLFGRTLVGFATKHRRDGSFHPKALRLHMQHVGLV